MNFSWINFDKLKVHKQLKTKKGRNQLFEVKYKEEIILKNIEIIKTDLENELLYLKGSIPGSKNSEILVKKSVKNFKKMTISEKIKAADEAKKTPEKKKKWKLKS